MSTPARFAQISSCSHRRRAEGVGGADQRLLARRLQQVRQLADGGRLAGAVDADNERDLRPLAGRCWPTRPRRRCCGSPASPDRAGSRRARARLRTAVTMRSVAGMPTSAEISSSSSASIVSTSIGRVRCSAVSACWTISSKRLTICCLCGSALAKAIKKPQTNPPLLIQPRRAVAAASARRAPCARPCGRRAAPPTCAAIGSSTPWRAPSASAASVVRTPSATIFMPARMSGSERPRASSRPTCRLRLERTGAGRARDRRARSARPASRAGRRRHRPDGRSRPARA